MGTVYAAYDPTLDRKVAVKLVRDPGASPDHEWAPIVAEARAMAKVVHPNVVTIFDVGEPDGEDGMYIAMEFVDGHTLRRRLEHEDWRRVLEVYTAAGRGLAAVHEAGLVHRDFKPDNAMIDGKGRVLIMDFGLARIGPALDPTSSGSDSNDAFATSPRRHASLHGPRTVRGRRRHSAQRSVLVLRRALRGAVATASLRR